MTKYIEDGEYMLSFRKEMLFWSGDSLEELHIVVQSAIHGRGFKLHTTNTHQVKSVLSLTFTTVKSSELETSCYLHTMNRKFLCLSSS